jgi:MFS family permease
MDNLKPSLDETEVVPSAAGQTPEAWATHFTSQSDEWRRNFERKLLRRVDLRLMPTLVVMYLLNFLDRSNLAQARQGTLEEDLGMSGTDFNLATSIFFVGYLLMQLPSNMLLTRVKPSYYLAASCCLWGAVSTCNAATQNFTQLVVVRFLLGFVEAPFFPGAVFLMSSWYNRAELTRRIAWLYTGNALANMFGGLLGAAILGNLEGDLDRAGWRWLFIIVRIHIHLVSLTLSFALCLVRVPIWRCGDVWSKSDAECGFRSIYPIPQIHCALVNTANTPYRKVSLLLASRCLLPSSSLTTRTQPNGLAPKSKHSLLGA